MDTPTVALPVTAPVGSAIASLSIRVQDVAPVGSDPGAKIGLELLSQVGSTQSSLGIWWSDGSGTARDMTLLLTDPGTHQPRPHVVVAGETLTLQATEISMWPVAPAPPVTTPGTVSPVSTVAAPPPPPAMGSKAITFGPGLATFGVPGGADTGPSRIDPYFNSFIRVNGGATSGKVYQPIILQHGAVIRSWSLLVSKTSQGTLTARLVRVSNNVATMVGHAQTISSSPGNVSVGEQSLAEVVSDGFYHVEVGSPQSGIGSGTDQTEELSVTFD